MQIVFSDLLPKGGYHIMVQKDRTNEAGWTKKVGELRHMIQTYISLRGNYEIAVNERAKGYLLSYCVRFLILVY